mmetsp:Transcript_57671/g.62293  ORF Transcript_57671/g.62293 Transcript_57671/m.62293 type:complete len:223 (-) Transcript_57671:230-898(-)
MGMREEVGCRVFDADVRVHCRTPLLLIFVGVSTMRPASRVESNRIESVRHGPQHCGLPPLVRDETMSVRCACMTDVNARGEAGPSNHCSASASVGQARPAQELSVSLVRVVLCCVVATSRSSLRSMKSSFVSQITKAEVPFSSYSHDRTQTHHTYRRRYLFDATWKACLGCLLGLDFVLFSFFNLFCWVLWNRSLLVFVGEANRFDVARNNQCDCGEMVRML